MGRPIDVWITVLRLAVPVGRFNRVDPFFFEKPEPGVTVIIIDDRDSSDSIHFVFEEERVEFRDVPGLRWGDQLLDSDVVIIRGTRGDLTTINSRDPFIFPDMDFRAIIDFPEETLGYSRFTPHDRSLDEGGV